MQTRNWIQLGGSTSATPATATALSATSLVARKIVLRAGDANTDNITFGADNTASFEILGASGSYELTAYPGTRFDLASLYVKSATAAQAWTVIYQA